MKIYYTAHNLWLSMIVLTLLSYILGQLEVSGTVAVVLLLLVSLIKSTIIIRDFMGLRGVSLLWRIIMYGWLWTVILAILIAYRVSL